MCLYLHLSQRRPMENVRAGMERHRQLAAELLPSPRLLEDVSDAASRVVCSYFGLCLYIKIANAETSCLKALDVLTS